jgi:hypothetical protein
MITTVDRAEGQIGRPCLGKEVDNYFTPRAAYLRSQLKSVCVYSSFLTYMSR